MLGADIANRTVATRLLGQASALLSVIALAALVAKRDFMLTHLWASESIVGIAVAAWICWLAARSLSGNPSRVIAFFDLKPIAGLG